MSAESRTGRCGSGPSVSVPRVSAAGGGDLVLGLGAKQLAVAAVVGTASLLVVVGAVAAGAFFFGVVGDGNEPDLQLVPAGSDTVTYVDVDRATSDPAIRRVVNAWLDLQSEDGVTMDDALAAFENQTGLDPDGLHRATGFSRYEESTGAGASDYSATVVRTDWEEAAFVNASEGEGVTYQQRIYRGHTLYEPNGTALTEGSWIAVLGDGAFVVGTENATKDVVDVSEGEMDPVAGEVKAAFEGTRGGYVRFATRVPESQVPASGTSVNTSTYRDVAMVSGAYYAKANALGLEMTMHATTESAAKDIEDVTEGGKRIVQGGVQNETVQETLRDVEVSRDGTAVTITYENSVDSITEALRALEASGDDGGGEVDPDAPQAGAAVSVDEDADTATVTWTSNRNADHLRVTFSSPDGPDDTVTLSRVGDAHTYEGEAGTRVEVTVTAVNDEGSAEITRRTVTL